VLLALTGYELGLLIVALSFIAFALIVALVIPRSRPTFPGKRLPIFIGVCIALFAAQMTAVLLLAEVGEADEHVVEGGPGEPQPEPPPPPGTPPAAPPPAEPGPPPAAPPPPAAGAEGDPAAGKEIFVGSGGCGGCHTLADAGTSGTIGPDLDSLKPSYDAVHAQVTNGGGGMPAFKDKLSEQQINDVAAYVSQAAGS
jgi:mono/diheme cytochrome c family protein